MKVAVVSTHPIQYQIPWFQRLAAHKQIDLTVYYATMPDRKQQGVGFDMPFAWDIPLLEGYTWELLPNKRKSPNLKSFFGNRTPSIYSAFARERPDAVIITGWHSLSLLQAVWACMRLGIPRIVRGDSTVLRKRPLWIGMLHRLLLSRFDAFLFVGKSNHDFYAQYGIPEHRLFAAYHFVDNERFASQLELESKRRAALRAAWKIPDGSTCFLFAGKIERVKRVTDLLRALEVAISTRPTIHLLVAGTGEGLAEARQFVASRGLPVTFAGFLNQTEITRAYAAADCVVLPSESETWGLVVNEAMVCGLPAIVSDTVGCAADLVHEGVTGGVFPCGDIDALASKLVEFAADPGELERMGARARELIKDYSVDQAVAGTLAAVEFVVRKAPQGMLTRSEGVLTNRLD